MIFIHNKYARWYYSIVNSSMEKSASDYTEIHHIIPKCLGGNNKLSNLVTLSAREHFICHWLLSKMVTGQSKMKMLLALQCMQRIGPGQQRYATKITSRVYEHLKSELSPLQSARRKGQNNPMYGKSAVLALNLSWYNDGETNIYVPEGSEPANFRAGRINSWNSTRVKRSRIVVSPKGEIFDSLEQAASTHNITVGALRERIRRNEANTKHRANKSYWSYI